MDKILPCPFCGGDELKFEDNDKFVSCNKKNCAGVKWFDLPQWQNRAVNPNDAFDQFAASLQVERDLSVIILTLIPEATNLLDELENLSGPSFRNMASYDVKSAAKQLAVRLVLIEERIRRNAIV